jgi:hypothetical protein
MAHSAIISLSLLHFATIEDILIIFNKLSHFMIVSVLTNLDSQKSEFPSRIIFSTKLSQIYFIFSENDKSLMTDSLTNHILSNNWSNP